MLDCLHSRIHGMVGYSTNEEFCLGTNGLDGHLWPQLLTHSQSHAFPLHNPSDRFSSLVSLNPQDLGTATCHVPNERFTVTTLSSSALVVGEGFALVPRTKSDVRAELGPRLWEAATRSVQRNSRVKGGGMILTHVLCSALMPKDACDLASWTEKWFIGKIQNFKKGASGGSLECGPVSFFP